MRGRGAATNLRLRNTGKTSTKWISVSDCAVRPRSGRENVAETCAPSPDANLRLTNLRLGCKRHGKFLRVARLQNEVGTKYI